MWPDLEEQVAVERAQIVQLFEAYQVAISKSSQQEPDFIELAALAAMLHSFYTPVLRISSNGLLWKLMVISPQAMLPTVIY